MKKIFGILFLAVLLVFAAGCVSNDDENNGGVTPSTGDAAKDAEKIAKSFGSYNGKDLQWRVLTVDEKHKKALLITEKCVAFKPFQNDGSGEEFTWESSDTRKWLNGEFYNDAFSAEDKSLILQTKNKNPTNSETGVGGEADTLDNVFLLSEKEVLTYFKEDSAMIAEFEEEPVQWWLRTPGNSETSYILIYETGGVYYPGSYYTSSYGVRPAVWVDLNPES